MDYYGLLFLYYLKGLSGKSILRLFFNIEVDGTEQLLPENTSTPTTTPILADIQYPDGLRTDQYFTYRETPTTVSNKARIKTIKGNTLVWNQLIQNGNFADTSIWSVTGTGSSFTVSNNIATIIASGAYDRIQQSIKFINGHKYLIKVDVKKTNANDDIRLYYGTHVGGGNYVFANTTDWQTVSVIKTASENITTIYPNVEGTTSNLTWQQRNMMIFDLTQMGLDISSPSDFTSLFSLPYYAYNQGTLLSFNGNGIKTVGFNQWDEKWESGAYSQQTGAKMSASNIWRCTNYISVIPNETYYFKVPITVRIFWYDGNYNFLGTDTVLNGTKTAPSGAMFLTFHVGQASYSNDVCINISSSRNGEYEPYTEITTDLPISTYFPTGMKRAGNVYDELTPNKAITRVGSVDLGTLTWQYYSARSNFYAVISDMAVPSPNSRANAKYPLGNSVTWYEMLENNNENNTFAITEVSGEKRFYIKNTNYSSVTDFMPFINGVYLYYELATETETPITTEDANEALSLLMGKSVSSSNAKQMIDIITKGE